MSTVNAGRYPAGHTGEGALGAGIDKDTLEPPAGAGAAFHRSKSVSGDAHTLQHAHQPSSRSEHVCPSSPLPGSPPGFSFPLPPSLPLFLSPLVLHVCDLCATCQSSIIPIRAAVFYSNT